MLNDQTIITMNVKKGEVSFAELPENVVVQINNYDTGVAPRAEVPEVEQDAGNLVQDLTDGSWYRPYVYTQDSILETVEGDGTTNPQTELPL